MNDFIINQRYKITIMVSAKRVNRNAYTGKKQASFEAIYKGIEKSWLVFELEEGHEKLLNPESIIKAEII